MIDRAIPLLYLTAAVSFILALKWLSAVPTARRGVIVGAAGMALAVAGTLLKPEIESYRWIAVAFVAGTAIGVPMAMMPMTAVPQRTALSHAFGALAAALVGTAEFYLRAPAIDRFTMGALVLEVLLVLDVAFVACHFPGLVADDLARAPHPSQGAVQPPQAGLEGRAAIAAHGLH